jgi:hypothetical protein
MPSQEGITTLKKILHAGKGEPLEFPSNTKVVFHYEVFIPPEPASRNTAADGDSNPVLFPEDRLDFTIFFCIAA